MIGKFCLIISIPIALLWLLVWPCHAEIEQPPKITVEVLPATVVVPAQGEVSATLIAHNPTTYTLKNIHVQSLPNSYIQTAVVITHPRDLLPQGMLTWTVKLAQKGIEPLPQEVHLQVAYSWQNRDYIVPQAVYTTLLVTPQRPQTIEDIVEVEIETTSTTLMEQRPGIVYLFTRNIAEFPITITRIMSRSPAFIIPILSSPRANIQLAPRETNAFAVELDVGDRIEPGPHLIVFEVAIAWEEAGARWTGKSVQTHLVQVGVLGESELLNLLGIPSLLILPGFLLITTFNWLMRNYGWWPKTLLLEAKSPEFWAFAVAISLAIVGVYPLLFRYNYLTSYGFRDITRLWTGAMAISVVLWVVITLIRQFYLVWIEHWKTRHRPTADDTPLDILRKLEAQGLNVICEKVEFEQDGKRHRAFLLEPFTREYESLWVGPPLIVDWRGSVDIALQQKVEAQLKPEGDLKWLAKVLAQGAQEGKLHIKWKGGDTLTKQRAVPVAIIQQLNQRSFWIEQE